MSSNLLNSLLNMQVPEQTVQVIEQTLMNGGMGGEENDGRQKANQNGQVDNSVGGNIPKTVEGKKYNLLSDRITEVLPNSKTQTTEKKVEYDDEKITPYVEKEKKEWEKESKPYYDKQKELLQGIYDLQKRYDITRVPQKNKDMRLNGLLMLANAISHLGKVTGEMAGDEKGGNRGMIPLRSNKDFEVMYNRYLNSKQERDKAEREEEERKLKLEMEKLKGEGVIDLDKLAKEREMREKLTEKARNLYKKETTKVTDSGGRRQEKIWSNPDITEKSGGASGEMSKRRTGGATGTTGKGKYRIISWSYKQPRWRWSEQTQGLPMTEVGRRVYDNEDFALNDTQLKKYYEYLDKHIKKLYESRGEEWKRARKPQDMERQINELATWIDNNQGDKSQIREAFMAMESGLKSVWENSSRDGNFWKYN